MTSGPADDDRPAYVIFHDIGRFRAQLFDRLIAPHGLTMSQAWVLAHLFVEDKLTQTEIARRMEMGTVTVGGLVDRLEAADLVTEMEQVKHPFRSGVKAQIGVEF